MALPGINIPDDRVFRWVSQFDDAILEYAITRTSAKVSRGLLSKQSETVGRYVTGLLVDETAARRSTTAEETLGSTNLQKGEHEKAAVATFA
jgi:hypothetical protein